MQITAELVKELRERTGAGMMDCKKSLQEADGDIEAAIEAMRKSGMAKAAKKAGRIAAEGRIQIKQNPETGETVILEVNSETDFVAKDENFGNFVERVADCVLAQKPADVESLMAQDVDGQTLEELRIQLVTKIGENISVRRFRVFKPQGTLGQYLHGNRIGVLVDLNGGDEELARDIAMHIAGYHMPPVSISEEDVPEEMIGKEKAIFEAQAEESGKPAEIIEKMVSGKVRKFVQEVSLLTQPFIKDPDQTIGQLLNSAGATVNSFCRYQLGEGLEKRSDNFADEVMSQARGE
ncbi:MAG TPA: translation elongation factor Ts [Gammaproteobacteria bacterium]|nr:translation elongation factor Ts [Gammaproteobacteria bacterium]